MNDNERRELIRDLRDTAAQIERVAQALERRQEEKALAGTYYTCGLVMGIASRMGVKFGDDLDRFAERARRLGEEPVKTLMEEILKPRGEDPEQVQLRRDWMAKHKGPKP